MKRRSEMYSHEKSKYTNKHDFSGKLVCGCCGMSYLGAIITVVRIIVVDYVDYKLAIKNEVKLKQKIEIYEQIK